MIPFCRSSISWFLSHHITHEIYQVLKERAHLPQWSRPDWPRKNAQDFHSRNPYSIFGSHPFEIFIMGTGTGPTILHNPADFSAGVDSLQKDLFCPTTYVLSLSGKCNICYKKLYQAAAIFKIHQRLTNTYNEVNRNVERWCSIGWVQISEKLMMWDSELNFNLPR